MITPEMVVKAQTLSADGRCFATVGEHICEICYRGALMAVIMEAIAVATPDDRSELWQDYGRVCDEMMETPATTSRSELEVKNV